LDREQLDKCPFLSNREGIYVVDISYMPEKYRLDAKRAQEILNSGLRNWLSIMDKAVQPPDLETEQTGGNSGARGVARNEPSGASELKKTRR
jgi:hypothetical protein